MIRTCYSGFGRGLVAEALNLAAVVSMTALACNSYAWLAHVVVPWWQGEPGHLQLVVFLLVLLSGILLASMATRRVLELLKGRRLHWTLEFLGVALGCARGLWWIGVVVLMLLSLNVPYLTASIEERSLSGPYVVPHAREVITTVADQFPGAANRLQLFPSVTLRLPKMPESKIDF